MFRLVVFLILIVLFSLVFSFYQSNKVSAQVTEILDRIGKPTSHNFNGTDYYINEQVLIDYGFLVYGTPGDILGNRQKNGQWEYLGFDENGQPFYNLYFPPDVDATKSVVKNWIYQPWFQPEAGIYGVDKPNLSAEQVDSFRYMIDPYKVIDGVDPNDQPKWLASYNAQTGANWTEQTLKEYATMQGERTEYTGAVVTMWNEGKDGKWWYQTFWIPPKKIIKAEFNLQVVEASISPQGLQEPGTSAGLLATVKATLPTGINEVETDVTFENQDGIVINTMSVMLQHEREDVLLVNYSYPEEDDIITVRIKAKDSSLEETTLQDNEKTIDILTMPPQDQPYIKAILSHRDGTDSTLTISPGADPQLSLEESLSSSPIIEEGWRVEDPDGNVTFIKPASFDKLGQWKVFGTVRNEEGLSDTDELQVIVQESVPPPPASNPPQAYIDVPDEIFWPEKISPVRLESWDSDGVIIEEKITFDNQSGREPIDPETIEEFEEFKNGEWCICDPQYIGLYKVWYKVEDDSGEDEKAYDYMRVLPTKPTAAAEISGRKIENRKIVFDITKSNDVSPSIRLFPIDYSKTTFNIVPADSTVKPDDIHIKKIDDTEYWAQFDTPGKYVAQITVTNSNNETSDVTEYILDIAEDKPPVIKYQIQSQSTRDPETGKAKIMIYDFSYDEEGDDIQFSGRYRYDSDNDVNYDDETYQNISFDPETNNSIEVTGLGKRLFELTGREYFTDYIAEFHKTEHFLPAVLSPEITESDRTNEVINIPPTYEFNLKRKVEADMFVIGAKTTEETKQRFRNSLNTIDSNLLTNDMGFSYQEAGLQGKMAVLNRAKYDGDMPTKQNDNYFTTDKNRRLVAEKNNGFYEIFRKKDQDGNISHLLVYIKNGNINSIVINTTYDEVFQAINVKGDIVIAVTDRRIYEVNIVTKTVNYSNIGDIGIAHVTDNLEVYMMLYTGQYEDGDMRTKNTTWSLVKYNKRNKEWAVPLDEKATWFFNEQEDYYSGYELERWRLITPDISEMFIDEVNGRITVLLSQGTMYYRQWYQSYSYPEEYRDWRVLSVFQYEPLTGKKTYYIGHYDFHSDLESYYSGKNYKDLGFYKSNNGRTYGVGTLRASELNYTGSTSFAILDVDGRNGDSWYIVTINRQNGSVTYNNMAFEDDSPNENISAFAHRGTYYYIEQKYEGKDSNGDKEYDLSIFVDNTLILQQNNTNNPYEMAYLYDDVTGDRYFVYWQEDLGRIYLKTESGQTYTYQWEPHSERNGVVSLDVHDGLFAFTYYKDISWYSYEYRTVYAFKNQNFKFNELNYNLNLNRVTQVNGNYYLLLENKYHVNSVGLSVIEINPNYVVSNYADITNLINSTVFFTDNPYVAIISDQPMDDPENRNAFVQAVMEKGVKGVFYLGTSANKSENDTLKSLTGGLSLYNSNDNSTAISNYMLAQLFDKQEVNGYVFVGEENLLLDIQYADYEGDPKYAEQFYFDHDKNYYESGTQTIQQNKLWVNDFIRPIPYSGKYTIRAKAQDDPTAGDERFNNYRMWSNPDAFVYNLYAHYRPVANMQYTYVDNGDGTITVNFTDHSYDLDRYSVSRGIQSKRTKYLLNNETTWRNGLPAQLTVPKGTRILVHHEAQDHQGAWSTPQVFEVGGGVVANFNVKPTVIVGEDLGFEDLSYSPSGTTITKRTMQVKYENGSWVNEIYPPGAKWTAGTYLFKLYVEDALGFSDEVIRQVEVLPYNRPPTATLTTNLNSYYEDEDVITTETASDPDGDPVTLTMRHRLPNGVWVNGDIPLRPYDVYGQVGDYLIELTATDNPKSRHPSLQALSTTVSKNITVELRNQPPIAGFTWTPTTIYEGDDVQLINQATDPDGDTLIYEYQVTDPDGNVQAFNSSEPIISNVIPGQYTITQTVTDPSGEQDTITKTLNVGELTVTGQVQHTDDWNENRISYNQYKTGTNDDPRPYNVFWAGERFVFEANTTNTNTLTEATKIEVTMPGGYSTTLTATDSNKTNWIGQLYDSDFDTLSDGAITFTFIATWNNGVVKTDQVTITIRGDYREYFIPSRNH